jgi:BolA protein
MDTRETIRAKLDEAFRPVSLEVIDESDQHIGHGGHRPGVTTHVRVRIVSPVFAGQTRVAMHRAVNEALKAEFAAGLHALAVEASGPAG